MSLGGARNCANVCPDYDHFSCVYIYDEGHCHCTCGPGGVTPPELVTKAALDSRVDLDVRGASLAEVGSLLVQRVVNNLRFRWEGRMMSSWPIVPLPLSDSTTINGLR